MALDVQTATGSLTEQSADSIVIPCRVGDTQLTGVPATWQAALRHQLEQREFTGERGQIAALLQPIPAGPVMVVCAGLGTHSQSVTLQRETWRRAIGQIIHEAQRHGLKRIVINLQGETDQVAAATAVIEAAELADYVFATHSAKLKKIARQRAGMHVTLLVTATNVSAVRRAVASTEVVMAGVKLARDLVNQPADHVAPSTLVAVARQIARSSPQLSVKVLNRQQARRQGFTAFLAVAQGSAAEPYVIHLTYRPRRVPHPPKIVLIGKGITFDSGGLSLKPADMMEGMKCDMAGAATVLGVFSALPHIAPSTEVHGIIATCENMPSGSAYRPGDVIQAMNGKTIEVINTDAEGRITLADALVYAEKLQPAAIIDIATLTGACMVALGETVAGLFTNNDELAHTLTAAAAQAGEGVATLPMPDEYRPQIESPIADLRNMGTANRLGGAITAAMFLREFVRRTPWAHLDIAGPASLEHSHISYWGKGGTGYGVRTLIEFLQVPRERTLGRPRVAQRKRTNKE